MTKILAVTEYRDEFRKVSFEVVSQARRIGDELGTSVVALGIGAGLLDKSARLAEYGADQILVADAAQLENYQADLYKKVVLAAVHEHQPELILFAATAQGKDLAPRVAAALNVGLASDCTDLFISKEGVEVEKPLYAGKVFARLAVCGKPALISIRPSIFKAVKSRPGANVNPAKLALPELSSRVVLKAVHKKASNKLDVTEADIIITGGRGMRSGDNFKMLEELAAQLNAAVGATRAVVDAGWRPYEEQVGQTGKVVSPNLYLICGASGSIQHWAGMSGSKCIVAINKDAAAPVFNRADYGIVGDLFEIVPALTEEIKKVRG